MPRSIDEGFKDFLAKLVPTDVESEAAKNHRASIHARLQTSFGLKRFVRIGSFGNGTSVSGYSDVDYLASLSNSSLTRSSTYSLEKVRNDLSERFPYTPVRVDCPAVVLPFGSKVSETTEIVPADYVEERNGYSVYDIADGSGGWMRASPDMHIEYVDKADRILDRKLKPLIRFVKAWKYFQNVPISSFYLELRIASYGYTQNSVIYNIDLQIILSRLLSDGLAPFLDPMGVSGYIYACKTDVQKADALSKLKSAASRAEKAYEDYKKGNIQSAFGWYKLLYGDQFPSYYY